ncbi:hypothetical protein PFISCL1PPCAC_13749, partial [Pristionchus fissidentatus]
RYYLILYSCCLSIFSIATVLCEIVSFQATPYRFVWKRLKLFFCERGIGVYLATSSIIMIVVLTLPIIRWSGLTRNWLYTHASSIHAIAPYCTLTVMAGLLIYCMPAFFFKPDSISIEAASGVLKQKFGLSKDYGYMAMVGYYGTNFATRWTAKSGLLIIYLFVIIYLAIALFFSYLIRKVISGKTRSAKRLYLEKRHLGCFWTQTVLVMALDMVPVLVWFTLPLFSVASEAPTAFYAYSAPALPVLGGLMLCYGVPELFIYYFGSKRKGIAPSLDLGTTNS